MKEVCILAVLVLLSTSAMPQRKHGSEDVRPIEQRPASDAHSFIELFGKLERDLAIAAEDRNVKVLDTLLAEEFLERDAAEPENSIVKAQWKRTHLPAYDLDPSKIKAMTIRAFLSNAVVCFVQSQKLGSGSAKPVSQYLIVDVWIVNHQKWQLASRFKSTALIETTAGHP